MKFLIASIVVFNILQCYGQKINFAGCEKLGWKCTKVQTTPVRYLIEYGCQSTAGVSIALWNFNAPTDIKELRISNCSSVDLDLGCTNIGRPVESLHIKNVYQLNFTNIFYKSHAVLPGTVIFEDIKSMELIPEKSFKQFKQITAASYRCANPVRHLEKIVFKNVNIDKIQQNAFFNLTGIQEFVWENVSVQTMEPLAMQVVMDKEKTFNITNGNFEKLDYKSISIRSPNIVFENSTFKEMLLNSIYATSFTFAFISNVVEMAHPYAFSLLAQDITFENNVFHALKSGALQGIGPGLLENALMSFGQLKFTYSFNNNTIMNCDIGGLNPDWIAYKNVRSYVEATSNFLPCSCKDLGWITLRDGLGKEMSEMMTFNAKFLDKNNKNVCIFSPCSLPVTVMAAMPLQFGQCGPSLSLNQFCQRFSSDKSDYGLGKNAKAVLNKWKKDMAVETQNEEPLPEDINDFEDILALSQKNEDIFSDATNKNKYRYSFSTPTNTYFKIEKSNVIDKESSESQTDIASLIEPIKDAILYTGKPDNENTTVLPFFEKENTTDVNYNINVAPADQAVTKTSAKNSYQNILSKEFQNEQKNFLKDSYLQWQSSRKKRMVYFKVYGNFMTME